MCQSGNCCIFNGCISKLRITIASPLPSPKERVIWSNFEMHSFQSELSGSVCKSKKGFFLKNEDFSGMPNQPIIPNNFTHSFLEHLLRQLPPYSQYRAPSCPIVIREWACSFRAKWVRWFQQYRGFAKVCKQCFRWLNWEK